MPSTPELETTDEEVAALEVPARTIEVRHQVYERMSRARYLRDDTARKTKEAFEEIAGFFGEHLEK